MPDELVLLFCSEFQPGDVFGAVFFAGLVAFVVSGFVVPDSFREQVGQDVAIVEAGYNTGLLCVDAPGLELALDFLFADIFGGFDVEGLVFGEHCVVFSFRVFCAYRWWWVVTLYSRPALRFAWG